MSKNIKKRILSLMLLVLVTVSAFSGCGKGSSNSGSSVKVKFIMTDANDTFRKSLLDATKAEAKSQGVQLDVIETGDDVDVQAEEVRKAKGEGYNAIMLRLTDASTALQMNVASNGLPIVYVNTQPDDSHLKADEFIYVGSSEEDAGLYQAKYVYDKLNKPSEFNAIIFEGEMGHSAQIGRTKSVKQYFRNKGVNVNYVFVDTANWSDKEAEEKFDVFMKTKQPVDAVFCNNDSMALGVVNAFKKYGLDTKQIPICGVDATADGCKSISEGGMSYTVLQDAKNQAKMAVKACVALGSNKSIKDLKWHTDDNKYIFVPFKPVDSSNVSEFM